MFNIGLVKHPSRIRPTIFNKRQQKEGESIEQYIRALYDLAGRCQFGESKDNNIRDRLVVGMLDEKLSQDLQLKKDLTLLAVEIARQADQVKNQITQQHEASQLEEIRRNKKTFNKPKTKFNRNLSEKSKKRI